MPAATEANDCAAVIALLAMQSFGATFTPPPHIRRGICGAAMSGGAEHLILTKKSGWQCWTQVRPRAALRQLPITFARLHRYPRLRPCFPHASHTHRLVCQTIPKNAHKSFIHWLLVLDGRTVPPVAEHEYYGQLARMSLQNGLPGNLYAYRHFAFVRNPYRRLVSLYFDKVQGFPERMTFEQFIQRVCALGDLHCDRHIRSQHALLYMPGLAFVGRLERIEEDMQGLAKQFALPPSCLGQLPHLHKSDSPRYQDLYTPTTRQLVAQRYARDLHLFNYQYFPT